MNENGGASQAPPRKEYLSEMSKSGTLRSSSYEFGFSTRKKARLKDVDIVTENIISIIAETNRTVKNSNILRLISFLWIFIQTTCGSWLLCLPNPIGPKWLHTLSKIVFFYAYGEFSTNWLKFLHPIIQGIAFLLTIIIGVDFILNNKYRKWEMYVLRYWHCHIYNIFIIPNLVSTMNSFVYYGKSPDLFNGAALILNCLFSAYCMFHVFRITVPLEENPTLVKHYVFFWRPNLIYKSFIFDSFIFGLCTLSGLIPRSMASRFFPHIAILLCIPIVIYNFRNYPYSTIFLNVYYHSHYFLTVTSAVLSIIYDACGYNDEYLYFTSGIVLTIFIGVFLFLHQKLKTQKFIEDLSEEKRDEFYKDNENNYKMSWTRPNLSKDIYRDLYFESLNISFSDAFYYLQVGIANGSPLLLDWSLSFYILEKYGTDSELLVFMTWIVSFFPSEMHILHNFITLGLKMNNPPYYLKCFFYQLHRIYIFRHSSESNESIRDLAHIRQLTKTCIGLVSWFWIHESTDQSNSSHDIIINITQKLNEADALWQQLVEKYPNTPVFFSLYSQYLLNAKSSFRQSAKWHSMAKMIENGTLHHNDNVFRGFLQMYPFYLKKKIVDSTGQINVKNRTQLSNKNYKAAMSSASFCSNLFEGSNSFNIEDDGYIPNLKLRLAFEKSVKYLLSPVLNKMVVWSIIRLTCNLLFIILIYKAIISIFEPIQNLQMHVKHLTQCTFPLHLLNHEFIWLYISSFPEISNDTSMIPLYARFFGSAAYDIDYYINTSQSISDVIVNLSKESIYNLDYLSSWLYQSNNDIIATTISDILTLNKYTSSYCIMNNTLQKIILYNSTTLNHLLNFYPTEAIKMAISDPEERQFWNESISFCELFSKPGQYDVGLTDIYTYLINAMPSIFTANKSSSNSIDFIMSFIPFILSLLLFPSIIVMTYEFENEQKFFSHTFSSIDKKSAEEAISPINKNTNNETSHSTGAHQYHLLNHNFILPVVIALIICFLMMTNTGYAFIKQSEFITLFQHYLLSYAQRDMIIKIGCNAASLVLVNHIQTKGLYAKRAAVDEYNNIIERWSVIEQFSFVQVEDLVDRYNLELAKYSTLNKIIISGDNELKIKPISNFDKSIDMLRKNEKCIIDNRTSSDLLFTQCISLDRLASYFITIAKEIYINHEEVQINSPPIFQLANMIESRISFEFNQLLEKYDSIIIDNINAFEGASMIFLIIELILAIISFFAEIGLIFYLRQINNTWKILLLRLNPMDIISNQVVLSWIFGDTFKVDKKIKTPAHAVFQTSKDAMILISRDHVIEFVNPSTTTLFGYTNDQIIGQNINFLLDPNTNSKFFYAMKMMNSGQGVMTYKDTVLGIRDNSTTVHMKAELFGLTDEDNRASSFAILLADMSAEIAQNDAINKSKRQNDEIIKQIIPKNLITSLINNDEEISFSISKVTVIAIDIDSFTSYAESLSPSNIMENLSKLINTFHKALETFPNLTYIRNMGDCYIAASGIFGKNVDLKISAQQALQFAFQSMSGIEELNININANLQIRIGITTYGPLYAGILSKNKPIFSAFGKPIEIALQLERNASPGHIDMTQSTYDLVNSLPYQIDEKGKMEIEQNKYVKVYSAAMNESNSFIMSPPSRISTPDFRINLVSLLE